MYMPSIESKIGIRSSYNINICSAIQWNRPKLDSDGPSCTDLYSEVSAAQGVST